MILNCVFVDKDVALCGIIHALLNTDDGHTRRNNVLWGPRYEHPADFIFVSTPHSDWGTDPGDVTLLRLMPNSCFLSDCVASRVTSLVSGDCFNHVTTGKLNHSGRKGEI